MNYEPVIGLEIHVQLNTKSKMFCASANNPDETEPNRNICEVCTAQPGSLPMINQEALHKAIMVGFALNCRIPEYSKFDRKNYFYPDLPKGYQISQYDQPICAAGEQVIEYNGKKRTIRINRAHLEEDAGKLIHEGGMTLVDLNRAGVPLLETVTEPDFRDPAETKVFLQNLRNIVRYLGVSDADMEKGHMRCDANISLRPVGETALPPYKIEIKNLNSFKAVEAALNYEIARQTEALEAGEKLGSETRGWDDTKGITSSQRSKEQAHDYRYFPEPDLPIMHFTQGELDKIRAALPELPAQKTERFISEFGLPVKDVETLVNDKSLAAYFEDVVSELQEWLSVSSPPLERGGIKGEVEPVSRLAKMASNWISGDFQALLKTAGIEPQDSRVTAENLAEMIKMIYKSEISGAAGKKILTVMFETGGDPSHIAVDEGLTQVSDEGAIAAVVDKVIAGNANVVTDYKGGKKQALGFLVGKVMAEMKGQANPQVASRLLEEKLRN